MHIRSAVAAISFACLACVGSADAALVNIPVGDGSTFNGLYWSGTSTLVASTKFENWLGLTRANPFPLDSVSTQEVVVGPFLGVGGVVTGLSYENATGAVVQKVSTKVGLGFIIAADDTLQIGGGRAEIRVSQLDLSQPQQISVFGSIKGQSKAGISVDYTGILGTASWSQLVGSTTISSASTPVSLTANQVSLNAETMTALSQVYGIDPTGLGYSALQNAGNNLGSFSVKITSSPVPEPSSWALMGLGVAAMGASLRRQRSQQA